MKQEEKYLLFKDLIARLPYGVKVKFKVNKVIANEEKFIYNVDGEYSYVDDEKSYITLDIIKMLSNNYLDEVKPYLFPLSSMTDEQIMQSPNSIHVWDLENLRYDNELTEINSRLTDLIDLIDWLNKNHFDYRGLIEKGLALDATGKNIYD